MPKVWSRPSVTYGLWTASTSTCRKAPFSVCSGRTAPGKTTAVRVLTTLLQPDSGQAVVAGIDVLKQPNEVRRSIGLSGQFAAVDEYLTGRENLQMVGQLYQMRGREAKKRAVELLERFNLTDAADRTAKTYSGGMRRRLDLAAALVVSPPVMFMDEPTTGLDPRNRQQLWEVIEELVAGGTTLLLTTQYLEEADRLAHDICVIDHGKVIARGTSDELKARTGGERVEVVVHDRDLLGTATEVLNGFMIEATAGEAKVEQHTRRITVPVTGGAKLLAEVIRELDARGIEIDDIGLRRPTLDDVFLSLTGHSAEDAERRRRAPRRPASDRDDRDHRPTRAAVRPPRRIRDSLVVAKRNLIRMTRIPEVVIFGLIQPIMFVVLFSYVFGGAIPVPGEHGSDPAVYRNFLMAGIFAQTVTFATAGAGAGIADDMHKGLIDRFRSLPMARGAVLTGRTIADLVQTALTVVVLAVVARARRLAHPQRRAQDARRLRAAAPAGVRVLLDRRADRPVGAHARSGHLRRADLAVPADVRLERVRADQPGCRAWLRTVADWNPFSATVQACRQLFGNPQGIISDAWPMQHPVLASLMWSVVIIAALPHPRGPQVPLGDGLTAAADTTEGRAPAIRRDAPLSHAVAGLSPGGAWPPGSSPTRSCRWAARSSPRRRPSCR